MWWLLLSALLVDSSLAAPDAAVEAERDRILAEMRLLESRGVWKGVDRSYRDLEKLLERNVSLSPETHLAGAEAARTLGDISALVTRLERAQAAGAGVGGDLASVRSRFTRVHLVAPRRLGAELECLRLPFELDARRAIEVAQASLATLGTHEGYLPLGDYRLGGIPFRVESSDDIVSVTLERATRKGKPSTSGAASSASASPVRPSPPPSQAAQSLGAPTVQISALVGFGGTTAARSGVHPPAAQGAVPGLAVSGRFPMTSVWAVEAGLGYRALLSASDSGEQVLHLGTLAARVAWATGDWRLAAGPMLARGIGRAQGIDSDALAACTSQRCEEPAPVLSAEEAQSVALEGSLASAGALLGVARQVAPALGDLSVGLEGGWLHDGSRSLLWLGAQATVHWSPAP